MPGREDTKDVEGVVASVVWDPCLGQPRLAAKDVFFSSILAESGAIARRPVSFER